MGRTGLSLLLIMTLSGGAAAGTPEAIAAFNRGDYATTLEEARDPARAGDAEAQYYLARLYAGGLGVKKDPKKAARYFRRAAEQGSLEAQFNLGSALVLGEGVEKDMVEALKWLILSGSEGFEKAQVYAKRIARFMNRSMIRDARRRARKWKKAHATEGGR